MNSSALQLGENEVSPLATPLPSPPHPRLHAGRVPTRSLQVPDEFLASQIIRVFLRFQAQSRASAFDTVMCLDAGGIGTETLSAVAAGHRICRLLFLGAFDGDINSDR